MLITIVSSFALVVQVGKSIIYLLNKPMDLPLPLVKTIKQKRLDGVVKSIEDPELSSLETPPGETSTP